MESVLLAAVLVLTALVLLDLALTLAIVRRLREQAANQGRLVDPVLAQLVGRPVPADLAAVAIDGSAVTGELLRGGSAFVAFVATWCDACHADLPRLQEQARARRAAGETVLVVVEAPSGDDASELVAALDGVALVVVESSGSGGPGGPGTDGDRPFHTAFDVSGFPTYLEIQDGTVRQVHPSLTGVPVPAGA